MYDLEIFSDDGKDTLSYWNNLYSHTYKVTAPSTYPGDTRFYNVMADVLKESNGKYVELTEDRHAYLQFQTEEDAIAFKLKWS